MQLVQQRQVGQIVGRSHAKGPPFFGVLSREPKEMTRSNTGGETDPRQQWVNPEERKFGNGNFFTC